LDNLGEFQMGNPCGDSIKYFVQYFIPVVFVILEQGNHARADVFGGPSERLGGSRTIARCPELETAIGHLFEAFEPVFVKIINAKIGMEPNLRRYKHILGISTWNVNISKKNNQCQESIAPSSRVALGKPDALRYSSVAALSAR
jgi:hypothetical protein